MKLLITGSRLCTQSDYAKLKAMIDTLRRDFQVEEILHGGAKGADQLAAQYALEHEIPTHVIKPDYKKYAPKQAPLIRNIELVDLCDFCVAMYKYEVKGGTAYTAKYADEHSKLIGRIYCDFDNKPA